MKKSQIVDSYSFCKISVLKDGRVIIHGANRWKQCKNHQTLVSASKVRLAKQLKNATDITHKI